MSQAAEETSLVTVGGKKPKKRLSATERKKKRRVQKMIAGAVSALLIIIIWYGTQPLRGTIDYGICRTMAELRAPNTSTLKIISYENYGNAWKIFYTFTGEYGEQRSNFIDCVFTNDAQGQRILKQVKINRDTISEEDLRRFNASVPAIIAGQPDLTIPPPLEESDLIGLRR